MENRETQKSGKISGNTEKKGEKKKKKGKRKRAKMYLKKNSEKYQKIRKKFDNESGYFI